VSRDDPLRRSRALLSPSTEHNSRERPFPARFLLGTHPSARFAASSTVRRADPTRAPSREGATKGGEDGGRHGEIERERKRERDCKRERERREREKRERRERCAAHARTASDTSILPVARSRADCEAATASEFHLQPRRHPSPLSPRAQRRSGVPH